MSLKFLAVGQSLAGIRGEKSPYSLAKENPLPTFQSAPRFKHAEKAMLQTDWLQEKRAVPAPEVACAAVERQLPKVPQLPTPKPQGKRGWLSFFGLKWFRTTAPRADLVQSELTLEKIQPVRNDLADSDLRLVVKRKKKSGASGPAVPRGRNGWSELTAKLFELGQR